MLSLFSQQLGGNLEMQTYKVMMIQIHTVSK